MWLYKKEKLEVNGKRKIKIRKEKRKRSFRIYVWIRF